jgi:hypothetical protein
MVSLRKFKGKRFTSELNIVISTPLYWGPNISSLMVNGTHGGVLLNLSDSISNF